MDTRNQEEYALRAMRRFAQNLPEMVEDLRKLDPDAAVEVFQDSVTLIVDEEHAEEAQKVLRDFMERSFKE